MTPGSNILRRALRVIRPQSAQWYSSTGRTANAIGLLVTTFAEPVTVTGSFQPIDRKLYQLLGLEWSKEYVTYYLTYPVNDVERDQAPDEFVFNGNRYRVMTDTDWNLVDGWNSPIAVRLTP